MTEKRPGSSRGASHLCADFRVLLRPDQIILARKLAMKTDRMVTEVKPEIT